MSHYNEEDRVPQDQDRRGDPFRMLIRGNLRALRALRALQRSDDREVVRIADELGCIRRRRGGGRGRGEPSVNVVKKGEAGVAQGRRRRCWHAARWPWHPHA